MGGGRSYPEFQFAQPNGRNKLRAVAQHAAGWTRKRPIGAGGGFPNERPVDIESGRHLAATCRDQILDAAVRLHATLVGTASHSGDWQRKPIPDHTGDGISSAEAKFGAA